MKAKLVKESLYEKWHPEHPGDTPADQGIRAARYEDERANPYDKEITIYTGEIVQALENIMRDYNIEIPEHFIDEFIQDLDIVAD